jgi:N-hydroxyarylamine O-acetyltransferase
LDVKTYLSRIGVTEIRKPTLPFLAELQHQHLCHVPFENLDILQGVEIRLIPEKLYEKVVHRQRGGFCYELNYLFNRLLQALGYSVSLISARVRKSDGNFGPEFDHMALIVRLQEEHYLVDVGFGDSCRRPLPLTGKKCEDVSGTYRIKSRTREYALEKREGKRWIPKYLFTTTPRRLADFDMMCSHQQSSPTSVFTKKLICTIATPEGRISVSDGHLTITKNGKQTKVPFSSRKKREQAIRRYFGKHFGNTSIHTIEQTTQWPNAAELSSPTSDTEVP